jgi:hypothetical protein
MSCVFCGEKSGKAVRVGRVAICARCAKWAEMAVEQVIDAPRSATAKAAFAALSCAACGKSGKERRALVGTPLAHLCEQCVGEVSKSLSSPRRSSSADALAKPRRTPSPPRRR